MDDRHRSPRNGYRSSSMGLGGVAAASQVSPDSAFRRHVMYNSDHQDYNRSFGRGQQKRFQLPQASPRRGDILMEAGRLATEYLVSKGLLPQNVFSGTGQNGRWKNEVGSFQGFNPQDGDNMHVQVESRKSALARLGDSVTDVGAGSRKSPDESNPTELRNYMGRQRRMDSFKNYGTELNRETRRSASWSEKYGFLPDKEGNDDALSGYQEEQKVGKDTSSEDQKSQSSELASKSNAEGNSESPFDKFQLRDDVASKGSLSSVVKDFTLEVNLQPTEKPERMKASSAEAGEVEDDGSFNEVKKQNATEDLLFEHSVDDYPASKNGSELLRLCRFAKVPTKTRSLLTSKGSRMNTFPITEDENTNESRISVGSGDRVEDLSFDRPSGDAPSNQNLSLKSLEPDILKVSTEEDAGEVGLGFPYGQEKSTRSRYFPERSLMNDHESSEVPPGFDRCSSMDIERGEKRSIEHSDSKDGTKKPREWTPSFDTLADDYLHLSTSRLKQTSPEGRNSLDEEAILVTDQTKLLDISLFPNGVAESCIEYADEKQLFPGSFKICDLNLMEVSDPSENHDVDPILSFPSISQSQKDVEPVDINLSMSNSSNMSNKYSRCGADGKEVEVIDLDSDSVQDDKDLNNSDQKDETLFTGLESFTNHSQNINDSPEVHNGYGLMISELLRTDMPNCSSLPPDVNSLPNEMGLNNGEGILGDDDSIYMSLGEIPTSFLRAWEQRPTQEYEKPF